MNKKSESVSVGHENEAGISENRPLKEGVYYMIIETHFVKNVSKSTVKYRLVSKSHPF